MLTPEQAIQSMASIADVKPDEFLRLIADDIPQNIMQLLIAGVGMMFPECVNDNENMTGAGMIMAGFQLGYTMAKAADGVPLQSTELDIEF